MNFIKKKDPTLKEMSSKGGKTTYARHGSDHFAKLGKKGRASLIKKDPDFYKRLSKKGIEARKRKREEAKNPLSAISNLLTGKM